MDCLVTGASRGIGRAIALRLAEEGGQILVNYLRNEAAALDVCAEIAERGGHGIAVQGDVRNPKALKALVQAAEDAFGGLDVLVHNAAIGALAPMHKIRVSHWDLTLESSLRPFWLLSKLARPILRPGGCIVGLSSLGSRRFTPGYAAMGAAKAGMEALTRQLAVELAPDIRVNTVCGGLVATDALQAFPDGEAMAAEVASITPMGSLTEPEHLADAVEFLCSSRSRWITGQVIVVDGGFSCL
ncbi:MAG: enoyl-[acyl-carrier protein] reductase III [Kiritimatiellia bacterium]|jgi:enoyl-[acyl-carrier protein] reductase III